MNISNRLADVMALLAFARAWLETAFRFQHRRAEERYSTDADSAIVRAAQAGIVISVVVIGVVSMVGILIFAQVSDAMPAMSTNQSHDNYSPLASTLTSITDGFGNAMSFVPIIMLVLLASVVIGVVQRMRT